MIFIKRFDNKKNIYYNGIVRLEQVRSPPRETYGEIPIWIWKYEILLFTVLYLLLLFYMFFLGNLKM